MRFLFQLFAMSLLFATAAAAGATSQGQTQLPFQLKLIGPNIWAAIDDAKGNSGANAGFVIGDSGVVVIDTFENETAAKALLDEIHKFTHLPIKFVVNTHYHLDHVAGNRIFANAGAVIVAHDNIRGWINTENLKFFGDKIKPEEKILVEQLLGPEVAYESAVTLYLGSRRIHVQFFAGHTGGDSVVSVPDAGVVFCGDLFWRKTLPNLIDATTSDWIDTLGNLAVLPHSPRAIPPRFAPLFSFPVMVRLAPPTTYSNFRNTSNIFAQRFREPVDSGKSGDDLVNVVLPDLSEEVRLLGFFQGFFSL